MADISDIKSVLYTEKSINMQEEGVVVLQTSPSLTKNGLKAVLKNYFDVTPLKINSLNQDGKRKRFKGVKGKRNDFKKFYVKLPAGATIESLSV